MDDAYSDLLEEVRRLGYGTAQGSSNPEGFETAVERLVDANRDRLLPLFAAATEESELLSASRTRETRRAAADSSIGVAPILVFIAALVAGFASTATNSVVEGVLWAVALVFVASAVQAGRNGLLLARIRYAFFFDRDWRLLAGGLFFSIAAAVAIFVAVAPIGSARRLDFWVWALVAAPQPFIAGALWRGASIDPSALGAAPPDSSGVAAGSSDQFRAVASALVLEPAALQAQRVEWGDPDLEVVTVTNTDRLSAKADRGMLVFTEASRRTRLALARERGAAVGLAGSRGVGKSEILQASIDPALYRDEDASEASSTNSRTIGVKVWAPVEVEPLEFLLGLLRRLAERVVEEPEITRATTPRSSVYDMAGIVLGFAAVYAGLTIAYVSWRFPSFPIGAVVLGAFFAISGAVFASLVWSRGRRVRFERRFAEAIPTDAGALASLLLRRIDFQERTSTTQSGEVGIKGLTGSMSRSRELERTPLTIMDGVSEFERLVRALAREQFRTVVAVDELDKLENDEAAIQFLNHLKMLFPVQDCSFVISVSENAWARFEQRGLPFRDAFDSALDEVIVVGRLSANESKALLARRDRAVSDLQALVCHCMSGGLPRDLLRSARQLAELSSAGDVTVHRALSQLVIVERDAKIEAASLRVKTSGARDEVRGVVLRLLDEVLEQWDAGGAVECSRFLATIDPDTYGPSTDGSAFCFEVLQDVGTYLMFLATLQLAFASALLTQLAALRSYDASALVPFEQLAEVRSELGLSRQRTVSRLDALHLQLATAEHDAG
jgi:hypothetical protein